MTSAKWKLYVGAGALVAGGLLGHAGSASAQSGALYRWESQDGTIAFTDDPKRIPERYRDSAETIDRTVLTDYGRYTPTDREASETNAKRLEERLVALREANEADEARTADAGASAAPLRGVSQPMTREIHRRRKVDGPNGSYYRYYENRTTYDSSASLPVDPNDPNPVVTERHRVHVDGEPITRSIVVTRQGDRVLSVTKPRSHYHKLEFGDASDYENQIETD